MSPMNPRLLRPSGKRLLLDSYGSAAAAYSLRRLSSSYTGPVVQVRRSSDNAEANFTAAELSGGTLAAWVGAGNDGFVKTWYDQSGNGKHAAQSTAGNQPFIIQSGSLLTVNSKPAIAFVGRSSASTHLVLSATTAASVFCVLARTGSQLIANYFLSGGANGCNLSGTSAPTIAADYYDGTTSVPVTASASTAQSIYQAFVAAATDTVFLARASGEVSGTGTAAPISATHIGNRADQVANANFLLNGRMQELIMWANDRLADRTAIKNNLNTFYSVQ